MLYSSFIVRALRVLCKRWYRLCSVAAPERHSCRARGLPCFHFRAAAALGMLAKLLLGRPCHHILRHCTPVHARTCHSTSRAISLVPPSFLFFPLRLLCLTAFHPCLGTTRLTSLQLSSIQVVVIMVIMAEVSWRTPRNSRVATPAVRHPLDSIRPLLLLSQKHEL